MSMPDGELQLLKDAYAKSTFIQLSELFTPYPEPMPSCVEVALLRLKKPSSTAEVEQNDTHKKALDIVTSQSHNLGCTWGVLSEDPTLLVWLVDWVEMEDHTKHFMESPSYPPFLNLLTSLLEDNPIVYMTHFTFQTPPSELASALHPTLQILQTSISSDSNANDALSAFGPLEDAWKSLNHRYVITQAIDDGMKDRILMMVAWRDITEAKTTKQNESYRDKFIAPKKHWKDIQLFGHITPNFAPPQLEKQNAGN